jgi:hypothetical protein
VSDHTHFHLSPVTLALFFGTRPWTILVYSFFFFFPFLARYYYQVINMAAANKKQQNRPAKRKLVRWDGMFSLAKPGNYFDDS